MILIVIDEHDGEYHGIRALADEVNCTDVDWLRKMLRRCEDSGLLKVIHVNGGRGRGNKATIMKRNRNQAGLARKVRRV